MRDTQPMSDRDWMLHVHRQQMILGDLIAVLLIGAALGVLALLYFEPCVKGSLC